MRILILAASLCIGVTLGQQYPTTTPVPILKQINRHNEDGSYSYGFEAADGSYKIESKHPNGEVYGKYGFVDDTGSVREIEYGATRRGFEPTGTGINVPPSTVNGNSIDQGKDDPEDDGQYREDPSVYYTDPRYTNGERYDPVPKTPIYNHQLQQRPASYSPSTPSRAVAAAYRPAPTPALAASPSPAPAGQYQIQYQPQQYQPQYQPAQPQYQPAQYQPQYSSQAPQYPTQAPQYQAAAQYQAPQYQPAQAQYQPQYQSAQYQPQYKTQVQRQLPAAPQYRPAQYDPSQFHGHPASRVDLNSGSYSVKYRR